jgi:CheY-like chemotaxis protein
MTKNNFKYDTAINGLLALKAFWHALHTYDIVLMGKNRIYTIRNTPDVETDISMPVMNGIDASRKIRDLERDRDLKPATIIALTGLASATAQQEAYSNGINLFLTKPVRFSDLRKILDEWTPDEDGCV